MIVVRLAVGDLLRLSERIAEDQDLHAPGVHVTEFPGSVLPRGVLDGAVPWDRFRPADSGTGLPSDEPMIILLHREMMEAVVVVSTKRQLGADESEGQPREEQD